MTQGPSGNTVVDLIAGNGGSTINFGTTLDNSTKVGRGGSISNVTIQGDIGDVKPEIAIRSYNDILSGERMADFVTNALINDPSVNILGEGNVGLVAGASGRVK